VVPLQNAGIQQQQQQCSQEQEEEGKEEEVSGASPFGLCASQG
jgi:hypothetical protein